MIINNTDLSEAQFYRDTLEKICLDRRNTMSRRLAYSALTFWDSMVEQRLASSHMEALREAFSKYVIRGPGCWSWSGSVHQHGYATFSINKKQMYAHRVSYMLAHSLESQPTMCVCHHCDNPICTNPAHLFLGTHRDNMVDMGKKRRSSNGKKTHCQNGHEFNEANTELEANGTRRRCRICKKLYNKHRLRNGTLKRNPNGKQSWWNDALCPEARAQGWSDGKEI